MLLAALALAAAQPDVVVRTTTGAVAGEALPDGRRMFRGVPFATPPLGNLRWAPPRPPGPWQGVRDAVRSAPACPQVDYGWNHGAAANQSEDCLYLEVATPALSPARKLPVMVWIHGGGNRGGSGAGTIWSDLSKHIVLVSIQYRLGALGFLSHPALTAQSPYHASGNYALMDQQAALRWVQENIAGFGGDPGNVTIFGESAGAQDVGLQMLAPQARGLFHKAIEESGTAGFGIPPRTLRQNEQLGEMLVTAAGAPAGADAATLRRLPAAALVKAAEQADVPDLGDDSFIWLAAVVDGHVLREPPEATLAHNGGAPVPLIVGSNVREFTAFGGTAAAKQTIRWAFGHQAARAQAFYDSAPNPHAERGDIGLQLSTDFIFACPAGIVAERHSRAGLPTWQYEFAYAGADGKPVAHGSEIHYVMQSPAALPPSAPPLSSYWLNFARTGDPNGPGLLNWPGYAPGKTYLRFANDGTTTGKDLRGAICRLRDVP
ncbi:carboxylesterase/lipase family protein [Sphingomonas crusticola]|uniref:carboxylesterase/lipase family protein n=1 Tax=Sphingomonas crusticola TaxID=1697973 RepID=UPI000E23CF5D|nr:carboxylesterase family protein [Sphingomonas crusticola]